MRVDDIDKAAEKIRITVPESEKEEYAGYILNLLNMLDTLPECAQDEDIMASQFYMRLRDDKITESISVEDVVKNAPKVENNCFVMPERII